MRMSLLSSKKPSEPEIPPELTGSRKWSTVKIDEKKVPTKGSIFLGGESADGVQPPPLVQSLQDMNSRNAEEQPSVNVEDESISATSSIAEPDGTSLDTPQEEKQVTDLIEEDKVEPSAVESDAVNTEAEFPGDDSETAFAVEEAVSVPSLDASSMEVHVSGSLQDMDTMEVDDDSHTKEKECVDEENLDDLLGGSDAKAESEVAEVDNGSRPAEQTEDVEGVEQDEPMEGDYKIYFLLLQ